MNFRPSIDGFAHLEINDPFWRQPFCHLDLLRFSHGARTAPSPRRARCQNDLPLGAPSFSTGC
jgi:hypothetical protein